MPKSKTMTSGPIVPELISLAFPLLLGNILQQMYNTVDTVIIGRWVGPEAFGAAGVAGTVMNLFLFVLSGGCTGISVLLSQLFGARDLPRFRRELFQAALFGGVFTVGLSLLALGLLTGLLRLIHTPAELLVLAQAYLQVIFAGLLAAFAYNLCAATLRAVGDTFAALCVLALSTVCNLGLDLLFVAVWERGITGAAWATVASQGLSALLSLLYLRLRYPQLLFTRGDMVPDRALLAATARFGAVSALHQSGLYLGKLLVQGAVNTLDTPGINAYTAAMRIEGFANSFGDSGCAAVSVFVGQNTGAGEERRVKRGFFSGLGLLLVLGVVMSAAMFFGVRELSILLLPQGEGQELAYSVGYLRTVSVFYALCFAGNALAGYFQGCGRVGIPVVGSVSHITLRAVLSWLLVGKMGLPAVGLATGLGWLFVVGFWTLVYRGVLLRRRETQCAGTAAKNPV